MTKSFGELKQKYHCCQKVSVGNELLMVRFKSYLDDGTVISELIGSEVFLIAKGGSIIWQISLEEGSTDIKKSLFNKELISDFDIIDIRHESGEYFAIRMNGDVFSINMESGCAEFHHWKKT